ISIFFFQAEDGIRDRNVTGVQTCALPIWPGRIWRTDQSPHLWMNSRTEDITIFPDETCRLERPGIEGPTLDEWIHGPGRDRLARSEERRVGKECGSRCARSYEQKQTLESQ